VFFASPPQPPPPRLPACPAGRLPDSSEKDGVQRRPPHDGGGLQEVLSIRDYERVLGGNQRDRRERAAQAGGPMFTGF